MVDDYGVYEIVGGLHTRYGVEVGWITVYGLKVRYIVL